MEDQGKISTHIDTAVSLKTVSLLKLCFKMKSEKEGLFSPTYALTGGKKKRMEAQRRGSPVC